MNWKAVALVIAVCLGWAGAAWAPEIGHRPEEAFRESGGRARFEARMAELGRGPKTYDYPLPARLAAGSGSFRDQQSSIAAWYRANFKYLLASHPNVPTISHEARLAEFSNRARLFFPALFFTNPDNPDVSQSTTFRMDYSVKPEHPRITTKWLAAANIRLLGPLAIVNGLPKSTVEYSAVFGKSASRSDMNVMTSASMEVSHSGRDFGSDVNGALLSESTIVVFVGHNDAGKFRLRSGHAFGLTELSELCEAHKKACLFVVCSGREWIKSPYSSFSKPITPAFAAHVINKMHEILKSSSTGGSYTDPLGTFQKITSTFGPGALIEYYYKVYGGVVMVFIVALVAQCDKDCPRERLTARLS